MESGRASLILSRYKSVMRPVIAMFGVDTTIFVVDDDEAVRDSLKLLLESHGVQVEAYASAEAYANAYRPRDRECLILDQHLQGSLTGLEFLISDERPAFRIPVILVTGRGDSVLRASALRAGAAAYLEKPVSEAELVATISEALEGVEC